MVFVDADHVRHSSLNNAEQVDAILLDLSKSFDKMPHIRVCHKLPYYGNVGHTLRILILAALSYQAFLKGQCWGRFSSSTI